MIFRSAEELYQQAMEITEMAYGPETVQMARVSFSSVCAQSSATRSFVLQHLEALAILHKKQDR